MRPWAFVAASLNIKFIIKLVVILFSLIIISFIVAGCEYFSFEGNEGEGWKDCFNPSWHLDTEEHNSGAQSLKSGSIIIGDDRIDTISGRYRGASKSGNISFWWKTDINSEKGKLSFLINNLELCFCTSDKWAKAGPFDFDEGDRLEWRAIRDTDKEDLSGNGWIDDVCIRYDDDLDDCCQLDETWSGLGFKNEYFTPDTGSLLSPFCFGIEVDNLVSNTEPTRMELQIKNENDELEIQKLLPFDESNNNIVFDNIRFTSPGKKKYRFICGNYFSEEYEGPEISPLIANVVPSEGSNLDSYTYTIDIPPDLFDTRSDIFLEIKDPYSPEWKCLGRSDWTQNGITFYVPNLNFIEPCLGKIEYRFRTDYGIIGPFKGPDIFINFRNIIPDPERNMVTAEVRSDRCSERICLSINGLICEKDYTNCPDWEYLEWENIVLDGNYIKIKSCD